MFLEGINKFLKLESASGILLVAAAILAMLAVNTPVDFYYDALLSIPVEIRIGNFEIAKPLLLWINDGLMAIFFFLIGLEVKREFLAGELSDPTNITLPAIAAVGGMLAPAVIYSIINWGDTAAMQGWAIPSATDIAFALGVLAVLGSRVPQSLKIFLLMLAIIDDLGAIVIIAVFYTADLSIFSLLVALGCLIVLFIMNRKGVLFTTPYILVGLIMWAAVLKSGVHATLAGVLIAFFIPFRKLPDKDLTQLELLEEDLHPAVAYGILPIFAFANTGVPLDGINIDMLLHPVTLGIAAGLLVGKQAGILGFCWLAVKLGITTLPQSIRWVHIYGVSILCGIGFTMSLFIGSLAFEQGGSEHIINHRLGILAGSVLSGLLGYLVLKFSLDSGTDQGR